MTHSPRPEPSLTDMEKWREEQNWRDEHNRAANGLNTNGLTTVSGPPSPPQGSYYPAQQPPPNNMLYASSESSLWSVSGAVPLQTSGHVSPRGMSAQAPPPPMPSALGSMHGYTGTTSSAPVLIDHMRSGWENASNASSHDQTQTMQMGKVVAVGPPVLHTIANLPVPAVPMVHPMVHGQPIREVQILEIIKEVPIDRVLEVPVEKVVYNEVEVPVERVVTVTKDVLVEVERQVPVDRVVEVPVEKIVTVVKEVPVTIEVERVVEKIVEVPVDRLVFKEVPVPMEIPVIKTVEKEVVKVRDRVKLCT